MSEPTKETPGNAPSAITPEAIQAALAVLTQAATAPKAPEDNSAKEKAEAVARATKVEALDAEIKALAEKKKVECLALIPLLQKHYGSAITLPNGAVVFVKMDSQKRATKKGITAYLVLKLKDEGEKLAKGLWASIKASTPRQGISVRRVGEPVVPEGEDGEGPQEP